MYEGGKSKMKNIVELGFEYERRRRRRRKKKKEGRKPESNE